MASGCNEWHVDYILPSWLQQYQYLGHLPHISEIHGVNRRVQFGPMCVPSVKLFWGLALDFSHQYLQLKGIKQRQGSEAMTKKEKERIESFSIQFIGSESRKTVQKYLLEERLRNSQLLGKFMAKLCLPLSTDNPSSLNYRSHIQIIPGKVMGIP